MKRKEFDLGYFLAELLVAIIIGIVIAMLMCISYIIVERLSILFFFDRVKVLCALAGMVSAVSFIWTRRVGNDIKNKKED